MNEVVVAYIPAVYSGHHYDVCEGEWMGQKQRDKDISPYRFAVFSSLTPDAPLAVAVSKDEAIHAAQRICNQHYQEYLEVLQTEIDSRGYTDDNCIDLCMIKHAQALLFVDGDLNRTTRNTVKAAMRRLRDAGFPPIPEAMDIHAQRALDLWNEDGRELRIEHYVTQVTQGD